MLSAGMPELNYEHDIQHLVDKLNLGMSDLEASKHFKKMIVKAMNNWWRRVDNFFHNYKAKIL